MLKKVKVEDAVGMAIPYDLTKIVPGEYKGPGFRKGHIIRKEDIPLLKDIGKNYIYVLEVSPDEMHENDVAYVMEKWMRGENVSSEGPVEGKITLIADIDGLVKVNANAVFELNMIGKFSVSTIHNNTPVKKGNRIAGFRAIPLVLRKEYVSLFESVASRYSYIVKIMPYVKRKVALVTTGTEIYTGKVKDRFGSVVRAKVEEYGAELIGSTIVPDDESMVKSSIQEFLSMGAELVVCTGGMSVDADDVTPKGIASAGAEIVRYGSPVLPGSMLLLAYKGGVPIVGIPAAGVFYKVTVFDVVLPRLLAGDIITYEDIARLGHGGFCRHCDVCDYPYCMLGKGW